MASRTQQRAQARERRLEQQRVAAAAAGRRRRLQLLVGTVVVALVLAAAGIAVSASGHGSSGGLVTGHASTRRPAQVEAELRGIPEHGTTLVDPHAQVTLTPYVTPAFLRKLAQQTPGLDLRTWSTQRFDPSLAAQVQADERSATRNLPLVDGSRGTPGLIMSGPLPLVDGSRGTPGLIMSGPRGTRLVAEGLVDYAQLKSALEPVS